MLALFAKLLKVLNSEQSAGQIAAAVSLAAIIGMTPLLSLHNIFILLLVLMLRVNLSIFLVSWPLFVLLGLLLEPASKMAGLALLQAPELAAFWEAFYNTLAGRWSNFYYSGVIGSLVISIASALVLYPLVKLLVTRYRNNWLDKFEKFHVVKMLKASKLWVLYQG